MLGIKEKDGTIMKKEKKSRQSERSKAIKEWLKSLIFPLIVFAVIVGGIFVILNWRPADQEEPAILTRGYEGTEDPIVLENDSLKLTMDPLTTQFTLEVKETGRVWYSNPQNVENDVVASGLEKTNLQSTLLLTYLGTGGAEYTFNNYQQSTVNGLYEIETGEDYIRLLYTLGELEREYLFPPSITEENYNKWLDMMDKDDRFYVEKRYMKYTKDNLKKDEAEAILAAYPILETDTIYVLRSGIGPIILANMEKIFENLGYTMEDYNADKALNVAESSTEKDVFNVTMILRLEGDELVVEVPFNELEFKESAPLNTLTLLPYFGAGGVEDEGYLLVPEGGGAIIRFNNGKVSQSTYNSYLYGWDMALKRTAVVHDNRSYFNAFGIANGDDSVLCIVEEGAPYVLMTADISGKMNSYNYANARYSVCASDQYDFSSALTNSAIRVFQTDLPDETLRQRYRFVNSSDYSDMAKSYQGYLVEKYGSYFTENDDTQAPVAIEILGAVDKVKQILGVPVSRPLKLTTYKEAEEMIKELKAQGMNNMSVKLTGWSNGGVNQKLMKSVRTISDLGSRKSLNSLLSTAKSAGVDIYLDGVTQYAYDSNLLNGFFSYRDAARLISKERAELYQYSVVTYAAREGADTYFLLHTDLAMQMADNLIEYASKQGVGVSFQDNGKDLSSDFYEKKVSSRQAVMARQAEQMKAMSDAGQKIMINTGNDYALPYSDMVTNMDLRGSDYTILDDFVPFYQMAIHGYVNYTGVSLNLAENAEEELLRSVEYGAGLSFTLMKESVFVLQKTLYTQYYGADYSAWHDRMLEIYNRYDSELGHTFDQAMTDHELFTSNLSCTTYEDGTRVYVNRGYTDAETPDGVKVPARDYIVVR